MALSFSSSTSASDSQATRRSRARFQPRRDTLERCLSYAVASKKKSRRGETAQKARKNEHDGRRARDHRSENPSLLPYQHVAVGAAPVVRQLEQGAQHPLVLVANRHPRHFGGKNMRGSARAKQKTEKASSAPTMGPASKAKKKE